MTAVADTPEIKAGGTAAGEDTRDDAGSDAAVALSRREWLLIWGFWCGVALLQFLNTLINPSTPNNPTLPWPAPLWAAIIDCLIWALLTPVIFRLTRYYGLERSERLFNVVVLVALGLLVAVCMSTGMNFVRYLQADYYAGYVSPTASIAHVLRILFARRIWFMNEFAVYLVVVTAGFARDYSIRYQLKFAQASRLQTQAAQLRADLAVAQLSALHMQLNPHFLFNALNTVSSFVEHDPRGARRMIADVCDLLRDTLDDTAQEVPLKREIEFIRRYLDIMQTRYADRLSVSEQIDADTLDALVPHLILQPLVENAIKHGMDNRHGTGHVSIRTRRDGARLLLSVLDDGAAPSGEASPELESSRYPGLGLGLRNTEARLASAYGDQQSFKLRRRDGGGVSADIAIPFHLRAAPAAFAP